MNELPFEFEPSDDSALWMKINRKRFGFHQSDCSGWLTGRMDKPVNPGRVCETEKGQREFNPAWRPHLEEMFARAEEKVRNGENPRGILHFD